MISTLYGHARWQSRGASRQAPSHSSNTEIVAWTGPGPAVRPEPAEGPHSFALGSKPAAAGHRTEDCPCPNFACISVSRLLNRSQSIDAVYARSHKTCIPPLCTLQPTPDTIPICLSRLPQRAGVTYTSWVQATLGADYVHRLRCRCNLCFSDGDSVSCGV